MGVFWKKNTFLYCPESKADSKKAITFLSSQTPSTRQHVRSFLVHFFLESAHMGVQEEELCARLQPLERIVKRQDRSVKLKVELKLWKSGENRPWQTCRHAHFAALIQFLARSKWRLKNLDAGIHSQLARMWESERMCWTHTNDKWAKLCAWV